MKLQASKTQFVGQYVVCGIRESMPVYGEISTSPKGEVSRVHAHSQLAAHKMQINYCRN